jgi:hypothetical protein
MARAVSDKELSRDIFERCVTASEQERNTGLLAEAAMA